MKIEDFNKIKEELLEQKKENDNKIGLCDERTRMAMVNSFEYKATVILLLSLISYFLLFMPILVVFNKLGFTLFENIIPSFGVLAIGMGSSVGITAIISKLVSKKYKLKERFKAFSTARTEAEKLEEEIYYQIELEKANNRNLVIDETISSLTHEEMLLRKMSSKYDISERNVSRNEEEVRRTIDELSVYIKDKYDKLDILSTQAVLIHRLFRKTSDMIAFIFMPCISSMAISFTSSIFVNQIGAEYAFIGSTIAMIISSLGYVIKRNKDYKKVFNSLNSKLGENTLQRFVDSDYEKEINMPIKRQIEDISLAIIRLNESKLVLEDIISSKGEDSRGKTNSKTLDITDEETKMDTNIGLGFDTLLTDGQQEDGRQETTPVKRRVLTNPETKK